MNLQTALHRLGLGLVDHPDAIHSAYRQLVRQWHPDQFARRPEIQSLAEEQLKQINQAYCVINEHIKNSGINNLNINNNDIYKGKEKSKKDKSGHTNGMMGWLRNIFQRIRHAPKTGPKAGTPHRPSKRASRVNKSGFEGILRQAHNAKQRRSNDTFIFTRRLSPASRYRRRSSSTRIEGQRTVSPVGPISCVPRIDPIEGSE